MSAMPGSRVCGSPATFGHLSKCKYLRGAARINRHDAVTDQIEALEKMSAPHVMREQRNINPTNRTRVDLTSFSASGARAIDTSIATPGISRKMEQQRHLEINSMTPFAAADLRIKAKNLKWLEPCTRTNIQFTPFVFEATGAIPPASMAFLMESANRAQEYKAHQVRNLLNEVTQKILSAIWVGNADLVATALWQAASGKFSQATIEARQKNIFDFSNYETGCVSVGGVIYGYLDIIADYKGISQRANAGAELEILSGTKEEEEKARETKEQEGEDCEE